MKKLTPAKKKKLERLEVAYADAKARFLDVFRRGDAAISESDLRNGYDAEFYLCRIPLLANHCIYYRREIIKLDPTRYQKREPKQDWDWSNEPPVEGTQMEMEF